VETRSGEDGRGRLANPPPKIPQAFSDVANRRPPRSEAFAPARANGAP
jgi:hypothetical protein